MLHGVHVPKAVPKPVPVVRRSSATQYTIFCTKQVPILQGSETVSMENECPTIFLIFTGGGKK